MTKIKTSIFLWGIWACLGLGLGSQQLMAAETPQQGIQNFLDGIRVMQFPVADTAAHQKLTARANAYLDLEAMGRKSMTDHWGQMTPEQQKAFMDLLWKLIENIAYPRTKSFLGEQKITYNDPKPIARGVEVSSIVKDHEAELDVPVVYALYEENGQWKIYDIFMDGVSMTEDLKFQFDRLIKEGAIPGLLTHMSERLIKAQKETKSV